MAEPSFRHCLVAIGVALGAAFAAPAFVRADTASPAAPPASAKTFFDVGEIRVLGNSVLPAVQIERVIYPFVGPNKTIDDLNAARIALETAYHNQGYGTVFVDLPEQEVLDGLVRLKVTEGRLAAVHVSGTRYFSNRRILAAMPEATQGAVPNLPRLQQQIGALNAQSAERSVVPILKAGPRPGTVDLALNVQDHLPLHASLEFNNQQTQGTRAVRGLFALSYDNLFDRLDQLSMQYELAPDEPDQVGVLAASLAVHLYDGGPALSLYYIDSKTNVSAGSLGILGKGSIYGLRLPTGVINRADFSSSLTFGLDYKHFLQSITVDPTTGLNTPNSYIELSADYAAAWRAERWQASVDTTANFGSAELVNDANHFATARYQGRPNFFFVHGSAALTYLLPGGVHATGRISGQGAVEPLVSNEYFSIAGADGVRGYLESEEFGDDALKGTLQLASLQLHPWSSSVAADMFVFFDDGRVTFLQPPPGQPTHAELRSTGAGIELLASNHFSGSLTWAYPLVSGPYTLARDSRILFVVRGSL